MAHRRVLLLLALAGCAGGGPADDTDPPADTDVAPLVDADDDGWPVGADCDDANPLVHPEAVEQCDGVDDDCDGRLDRDDAPFPGALGPFYADRDVDGFGDPATAVWGCRAPDGLVGVGDDCDDADPNRRPGAVEICDGVDDDCDALVDDDDPDLSWASSPTSVLAFVDADGDGFGVGEGVRTCGEPGAGFALADGDCDDADARAHPGAAEVGYDGVDEDCLGGDDDDLDGDGHDGAAAGGDDCDDADAAVLGPRAWWADADHDGWSPSPGTSVTACAAPVGHGVVSAWATDCDDTRADVHPGATDAWYDGVDADCLGDDDQDRDRDGHRVPSAGGDDCDDTLAAVHPGATEVPYDGLDQDCAGGDACDVDGDGVAANAGACGGDDCDDGDARRAPGKAEVCDGVDDDCDRLVDDLDPSVRASDLVTHWRDVDGDGFGDPSSSKATCAAALAGWVENALDCGPSSASVHPGAPEVCDLVDDDCDGSVDDLDPDLVVDEPWGTDADDDGFPIVGTFYETCDPPFLHAARYDGRADCDDGDADTFPGAATIELGAACAHDRDDDGWGAIVVPAGVVAGTDCDDLVAGVNPGQPEVWYDGIDEACDGGNDGDRDGDGHVATGAGGDDCVDTDATIHPGATEVAGDGIDQDCVGGDLCPAGSGVGPACAPLSCKDAHDARNDASPIWVKPAGQPAAKVACRHDLDDGGWTHVATVSEDGTAKWTWNAKDLWGTSTTTFGTLERPDLDFRSAAFRSAKVRDLLFVHAPSGVWAAYHAVGNGTLDLGSWVASYGENRCWGTAGGFPMSAGTLAVSGYLCSTQLFVSPEGQFGSTFSCSYDVNQAYGPAWSARYRYGSNGCPLDYPGITASLGPDSGNPGVEWNTLGWAESEALNLDSAPAGTNHMRVYVR